ncbi:MAG TPA: DnaB-like helicase C-terminal domain-containing protein [Candidatus Nanoarchaeia archaeon]|nr:DnaB-like helicase C-terminal domain-containing protein [Candidatus Nanoarchaeia archaeon]
MIEDFLSEQLAVGLMLNSREAAFKGIGELDDGDFANPNFIVVFRAIRKVIEQQKEVDIFSVNSMLENMGKPLSLEELFNIEDKFYVEEKFDSIIEILHDKKNRRITDQKLKEVSKRLNNDNTSFDTIIRDIDSVFDTKTYSSNVVSGTNYLEFRAQQDKEKRERKWILTGFEEIDNILTYKISRGEISVIAARPSNGKSALKTNLIKNMCEQGVGVVNYALEQTMEVESDRLESLVSGIPGQFIVDCHIWEDTDFRKIKLMEAREKIATWNYHLIEGISKSLAEIKSELRMLKRKGIEIAFFDLFDRIKDVVNSTSNKAQQVTKCLTEMLAIAKELNIHICVIVQLNRDLTKRKSMIPQLSDLKDSGAYEEVARTVFFLHYPKAHDRKLVESNITWIIAKQNNGPLFEMDIPFQEDIGKFISKDPSNQGIKKKGLSQPSSNIETQNDRK